MTEEHWITACWLEFLNLAPELRRYVRRGKVIARKGLVENLEVVPGLASAEVRADHGGFVSVKIRQQVIRPEEWDDLLEQVATNAGLAAELLGGQVSEAMSELFVDAGLELFPYEVSDVKNYCTSGEPGPVSIYSVATHIALAQAFAAAPLLLLTFRGLSRETLFNKLRGLRDSRTESSSAESSSETVEASGTEDMQLLRDGFWGGKPLPSISFQVGAGEADDETSLPVIRALGDGPSGTPPDQVARVLAPILTVAQGRLDSMGQVTMELDKSTESESTEKKEETGEESEDAMDKILVSAAMRHGSLTVEFVAQALKVDTMRASRYLKWLVEEGRLRVIRDGGRKRYAPRES
jgi:uncharacterized Zn finger protein